MVVVNEERGVCVGIQTLLEEFVMDTKMLSKVTDLVEDLTEVYRRSLIVPKAGQERRAEVDKKTREFHEKLMEQRVWGRGLGLAAVKGERA